ncbi:glycosyltransferase [Arthrobacter rhombi]|uniref:glycosyltransferase n=1 Tax=Arthrobacter rhombi TaxID=71253 RepID=UPI003FD2368B
MKICQLVAYVSKDGAYGGPTAVAFAQCHALSQNHDVTLAAGVDHARTSHRRAPYKTQFKRAYRPLRSFGSLISPALLYWFARNARTFDIVHIHLARDFLVMPAAVLCRLMRVPYVVQTHGMIKPARGVAERLYDMALTRTALMGAARLFFLTSVESANLTAMRGPDRLQELHNAVHVPALVAPRRTPPTPFTVLSCSRLHKRKRPELFIAAAHELERRYPGRYQFRLVGPDGGQLRSILDASAAFPDGNFSYEGAVAPSDVSAVLAKSDVLVLPSINEPFPMIVLEALSNGVPAVIDETCGLAPLVNGRPGVRVVNSNASSLADAVDSVLSNYAEESTGARQVASKTFSLESLGLQLQTVYQDSAA